jgi:hypothetical protein
MRTLLNPKLIIALWEDECLHDTRKRYQEMVGYLMWPAITMRPDIAAATSKLAQFLANPPPQALEAVNHVYRYLRGTIDLGITYRADQRDELEGSSDSNWGDNNSIDKVYNRLPTHSLVR